MTEKHASLLMDNLAAHAKTKCHSNMELAEHLSIGYIYLMQLLSGKRETSVLGRKVLVASAKYLDIPVAEAYLLAGALEPTDFIHESAFELGTGDAYTSIVSHPQWGGFMPTRAQWEVMPNNAKVFVIFAFEQATGIEIIKAADKTNIGDAQEASRLMDSAKCRSLPKTTRAGPLPTRKIY